MKPKVEGGIMVARAYPLLVEAVESGCEFGWNHAHKHVENPTKEHLLEKIADDIMLEICERFDFPEAFGDEDFHLETKKKEDMQ